MLGQSETELNKNSQLFEQSGSNIATDKPNLQKWVNYEHLYSKFLVLASSNNTEKNQLCQQPQINQPSGRSGLFQDHSPTENNWFSKRDELNLDGNSELVWEKSHNKEEENSIRDQPKTSKSKHIKKPLNAFMLFMKDMRAQVVSECTLKESAAINQILGRKWHALTQEDQAKYYEMARREKELHQKMYPGWSARDNYAMHSKKRCIQQTQANSDSSSRSSEGTSQRQKSRKSVSKMSFEQNRSNMCNVISTAFNISDAYSKEFFRNSSLSQDSNQQYGGQYWPHDTYYSDERSNEREFNNFEDHQYFPISLDSQKDESINSGVIDFKQIPSDLSSTCHKTPYFSSWQERNNGFQLSGFMGSNQWNNGAYQNTTQYSAFGNYHDNINSTSSNRSEYEFNNGDFSSISNVNNRHTSGYTISNETHANQTNSYS